MLMFLIKHFNKATNLRSFLSYNSTQSKDHAKRKLSPISVWCHMRLLTKRKRAKSAPDALRHGVNRGAHSLPRPRCAGTVCTATTVTLLTLPKGILSIIASFAGARDWFDAASSCSALHKVTSWGLDHGWKETLANSM